MVWAWQIQNSAVPTWSCSFHSFRCMCRLFYSSLHTLYFYFNWEGLLGETAGNSNKKTLHPCTNSSGKQHYPRIYFGSLKNIRTSISSAVVHVIVSCTTHDGNMLIILLMKTLGTTSTLYLTSSSCWNWSMAAFPEIAYS